MLEEFSVWNVRWESFIWMWFSIKTRVFNSLPTKNDLFSSIGICGQLVSLVKLVKNYTARVHNSLPVILDILRSFSMSHNSNNLNT